MGGLREDYNIEDLYIVKLNKEELNGYIYKTNFYYIVEKFSYQKDNVYSEIYKESVGGTEMYKRRSYSEFNDLPPVFSELYKLPADYLTEEERKSKIVSSNRLYYISLDINMNLLSFKNLSEDINLKKLNLVK